MTEWVRQSNLIEDIDDPKEDSRSEKAWLWFKTKKLTIPNILRLHWRITINQLGIPDAGRFRKCRVWVGDREGEPWEKVPMLMQMWMRAWSRHEINCDELCFKSAHIAFEHIHPFVDGNGRTGRMVMNWQRVNAGFPPLLLKASERHQYYKWFH